MLNYKRMFKKIKQKITDKKSHIFLLIIILSLLILWKLNINIIIAIIFLSSILLYGWESGFIAKRIKEIKKYILNKKWQSTLLVIILTLLLTWSLDIKTIILGMIFFIFLIYRLENRALASIALISLAVCPIFLIFKKQILAEQIAIYIFYLLVMVFVLQLIEYISATKKPENN